MEECQRRPFGSSIDPRILHSLGLEGWGRPWTVRTVLSRFSLPGVFFSGNRVFSQKVGFSLKTGFFLKKIDF
jgi:hypothetical protein